MRTVPFPLLCTLCLFAGSQSYSGLAHGQVNSYNRPIQAAVERPGLGSFAQRPGTVARHAVHFNRGITTATDTFLANGMVQFAYSAKAAICGLSNRVIVRAGSPDVGVFSPSGDPPTGGLAFIRTAEGWKLAELGVVIHARSFNGELKRLR